MENYNELEVKEAAKKLSALLIEKDIYFICYSGNIRSIDFYLGKVEIENKRTLHLNESMFSLYEKNYLQNELEKLINEIKNYKNEE